MDQLPDDIFIYNIYPYLNYLDIMFVNKKFNKLKNKIIIKDKFKNPKSNIRYTHIIFENINYSGYIYSVLNKYKSVSSIKLINCSIIKNRKFPNCQELYIKNCVSDIFTSPINEILQLNTQLTKLCLIDDKLTNFIYLSRLKNLTHLYLGSTIYNSHILYYISKLPKLEYLYINIYQYNSRDINFLKGLKNLKILKLQIK